MSGLAEKMALRTNRSADCWIWTGDISPDTGYGRVTHERTRLYAHRVAYELAKGPIPEGLVIDHLCRVRHCVNPDHLEPVTIKENSLRGESFMAHRARAERCERGHPFDAANTHIPRDGRRRCRACIAITRAAYNERRRVDRQAS